MKRSSKESRKKVVLSRPIIRALTAMVLAVSALVYVNPASADLARSGSTVLVSAFPDGTPADGGEPSVSADGRYVAFASWDKLLPEARDNCREVYRKDMTTGELIRISGGTPCSSYLPSISADGNKVLYIGGFCNHGAVNTNCYGYRAYVRDIGAGTTTTVSNTAWQVEHAKLSSNGNYAVLLQSDSWDVSGALVVDARGPFSWSNAWNIGGIGLSVGDYTADISADGRYAVFESDASHVPQDTDDDPDVYLYDRVTNAKSLVGIHPSGEARISRYPSISADGTVVVFRTSEIPNALSGSSIPGNVYARHLPTATTTLISQSGHWISPLVGGEMKTSVSGDGNLALFNTALQQLAIDTNPGSDVYMRNIAAGRTSLVSVLPDGTQGIGYRESFDISDSGRFVTFESRQHVDLPNERRVYLRDLQSACSLAVCPLDYP